MKYWQIIVDCIAVISFLMYLRERRKRRDQDILLLGFLHGIKPVIEGAAEGVSPWKKLVEQINDMLARLQPPKRARRVYKPEPSSE
jgi:hypothetical protein